MKPDWKWVVAHVVGVAAVVALIALHYISTAVGLPLISAILGISVPSPVWKSAVDPDQTVKP